MDQDRAEFQRPDAEAWLEAASKAILREELTPDEIQILEDQRRADLDQERQDEDLREVTNAILAARLDAQELEKWEVVPEPDRMPPWAQYRLLSRELESWIVERPIRLRRGLDIPRDTPILALRKRLDRAMWLRGGLARVWEEEPGGDIFLYLGKGPNWKGFSGEREEPLI